MIGTVASSCIELSAAPYVIAAGADDVTVGVAGQLITYAAVVHLSDSASRRSKFSYLYTSTLRD